MGEATILIQPGATNDFPRIFTRQLARRARPPTDMIGELKLKQALQAFDTTTSWEEARAARDRVLALSVDVVPSVLRELGEPQPPERFDVLIGLLIKWNTIDEVLEILRAGETRGVLRASLTGALGYYASEIHAADEAARSRVAAALAALTRDLDVGVRIAAVEAIGLAGLSSGLREVLRERASLDSNDSVRAEAAAALEEIE